MDVAEAIGPDCEKEVVGIRPGEKIHEEMITASDSYNTWDLGKYYVILPQKTRFDLDEFVQAFQARKRCLQDLTTTLGRMMSGKR